MIVWIPNNRFLGPRIEQLCYILNICLRIVINPWVHQTSLYFATFWSRKTFFGQSYNSGTHNAPSVIHHNWNTIANRLKNKACQNCVLHLPTTAILPAIQTTHVFFYASFPRLLPDSIIVMDLVVAWEPGWCLVWYPSWISKLYICSLKSWLSFHAGFCLTGMEMFLQNCETKSGMETWVQGELCCIIMTWTSCCPGMQLPRICDKHTLISWIWTQREIP